VNENGSALYPMAAFVISNIRLPRWF